MFDLEDLLKYVCILSLVGIFWVNFRIHQEYTTVTDALHNTGYTITDLGGDQCLPCDNDEHWSISFKAFKEGKRVLGTVCCESLSEDSCIIKTVDDIAPLQTR